MKYAIVLRELPEELGGGYQGIVPDLHGCMSDGDTIEEALSNTIAAAEDWLAVCAELGRPVPEPGLSHKRASEREKALLETIKVLSEQYDGLDERIDAVQKEIDHLRELFYNYSAWTRFEAIVEPSKPKTGVSRAFRPC